MKTRMEIVARRRQMLIAESCAQRADLALQMQPVMYALESANSGLRIAGRIRQHPGWLATIVAGLLLVTPRRLSALLQFCTQNLRTWRSLAPALRILITRH